MKADAIRLVSARNATRTEGDVKKPEQLKKRLDKQRPMTTISMRLPEDVIDDLKRVAPHRGFSGYQPLIRAYVGQALRADLQRLEQDPM